MIVWPSGREGSTSGKESGEEEGGRGARVFANGRMHATPGQASGGKDP